MAIRFGGSSAGYTVITPNFETRNFDCGSDYKVFIDRIDKVCREVKQINDALCQLQEINETIIKPRARGDCLQRINVTINEIPYRPFLEARNPCADITSLPLDQPLLKVADSTCDPGVKAIEITIAISGYGDASAFLTDNSIIISALQAFGSSLNEVVTQINRAERWIIESFDYNAPITDFHTFDLSIKGTVVPASNTDRVSKGGCQTASQSKSYQVRYTLGLDFQNGVVQQQRVVSFTADYGSITEAVNGFTLNCV